MSSQKILLSADTPCDIGSELKERYHVSLFPLHIILSDKQFTDGLDITSAELYEAWWKHKLLPRTAKEQSQVGDAIDRNELKPGDLVFFETYEPGASHNGIYVGDGNFIGANSGTGVAVASLASPYWRTRYLGARRLF